jgi:hypothetical protein
MSPKREILMKLSTIVFLTAVMFMPAGGLAKQITPRFDDIQIELAQENEFVVKLIDVIDKSGKKIKNLVELDSFSNKKKVFVFKNSNGKFQRISAEKIKKITFSRLRQGVLTGKPKSLRVNVWNGEIKKIKLNYRAVKIKDGYLFMGQDEVLTHFAGSDTLRANNYEWSEKLSKFWQRKKEKSPKIFSSNFAFKDGYGIISRKMAAAYCQACLKIEILNLTIDPKKKTILIHCKDVFYDKYNE